MTQLSAAEVLQSKYMPCVIYNFQPCAKRALSYTFTSFCIRRVGSLQYSWSRKSLEMPRRYGKQKKHSCTTPRLPKKFFIRIFKEEDP